jgi:hypothetical protein
MLPCNKNVEQGQVNGTQVTLEKVVLKAGVTPQVVCIGENIPVMAVHASEVAHVVVKHCNNSVQLQEFSLQPKKCTFKGKLPKPITFQEKEGDCESIKMKATQLPVLVNNATTGHKLQGSGIDKLFLHNWSYVTNWPYVMLSLL